MGIYLNPGSRKFEISLKSEIYVDKTSLIAYTNSVVGTDQRYVCVSRPRRFGKSMAVGMLAAYYGCEEETGHMFKSLDISTSTSYQEYLNQFEVIQLDIQEFLSESSDIDEMLDSIKKNLLWELTDKFSEVRYYDKDNLVRSMRDIYLAKKRPFCILIDEWDCVFRELKEDKHGQKKYLDFLRNWLKDKPYVALAYMTGILPIKKYGSHSALNMFDEFSMIDPGMLAGSVGFTENEVKELCTKYNMDFYEMKAWYDGYSFDTAPSVYSPKSVVSAILRRKFGTYWNQTETYEALKIYIQMNYNGLKDSIIGMLAGEAVEINTERFSNDMMTFSSKDDVLTLLVHLGYLGYDDRKKSAFIPNREVSLEYINAMESLHWDGVVNALKDSEILLEALWNADEEAVASGVEKVHLSTSILQYNDENALSYTIGLAFYAARQYYTVIREMPAGKGFADICLLPRPHYSHKPAVIIELKWNQTAEGAIQQIRDKGYVKVLESYKGNILLAGISYDKKQKKHECKIEKIQL
ncbi:MAG: AAA family ATPase [Eubacteriales bacterium]|nr:AAA family ATPase [Eubacteriales bacterium]